MQLCCDVGLLSVVLAVVFLYKVSQTKFSEYLWGASVFRFIYSIHIFYYVWKKSKNQKKKILQIIMLWFFSQTSLQPQRMVLNGVAWNWSCNQNHNRMTWNITVFLAHGYLQTTTFQSENLKHIFRFQSHSKRKFSTLTPHRFQTTST